MLFRPLLESYCALFSEQKLGGAEGVEYIRFQLKGCYNLVKMEEQDGKEISYFHGIGTYLRHP